MRNHKLAKIPRIDLLKDTGMLLLHVEAHRKRTLLRGHALTRHERERQRKEQLFLGQRAEFACEPLWCCLFCEVRRCEMHPLESLLQLLAAKAPHSAITGRPVALRSEIGGD